MRRPLLLITYRPFLSIRRHDFRFWTRFPQGNARLHPRFPYPHYGIDGDFGNRIIFRTWGLYFRTRTFIWRVNISNYGYPGLGPVANVFPGVEARILDCQCCRYISDLIRSALNRQGVWFLENFTCRREDAVRFMQDAFADILMFRSGLSVQRERFNHGRVTTMQSRNPRTPFQMARDLVQMLGSPSYARLTPHILVEHV